MKDIGYVGLSTHDKEPRRVQLHKLIWQKFGTRTCQCVHVLFGRIYEYMKPIELRNQKVSIKIIVHCKILVESLLDWT